MSSELVGNIFGFGPGEAGFISIFKFVAHFVLSCRIRVVP